MLNIPVYQIIYLSGVQFGEHNDSETTSKVAGINLAKRHSLNYLDERHHTVQSPVTLTYPKSSMGIKR